MSYFFVVLWMLSSICLLDWVTQYPRAGTKQSYRLPKYTEFSLIAAEDHQFCPFIMTGRLGRVNDYGRRPTSVTSCYSLRHTNVWIFQLINGPFLSANSIINSSTGIGNPYNLYRSSEFDRIRGKLRNEYNRTGWDSRTIPLIRYIHFPWRNESRHLYDTEWHWCWNISHFALCPTPPKAMSNLCGQPKASGS